VALHRLAGLSIRWKLPLLVCGVSLAVAGAILWTAHREVRRSAITLTEERLVGAMGTLSDRLGIQLRSTEQRLHGLAADPAVQRYFRTQTPENHDALLAALGTIREGTGNTLWIDAVAPEGAVLAPEHDPPSPVGALAARDLAAWSSGPDAAGAGNFRVHNDSLVFPLIARVGDTDEFPGYLVVWQHLTPTAIGSALIADLVGAEARFLLGSPGGAWSDEDGIAEPPAITVTDTASLQRFADPAGQRWLASVRHIPASPWIVVAALPELGVLAPARRFLVVVGGASLLIAAVGVVLGSLMSRRITSPIGALTMAAEAVGEGSHHVRVPVVGGDEVGRLAVTFNRMAERVDQEAMARELAEEQWRLLFVENPHPMWVFDRESLAFLAVNEAAVANYGYSRDEFLAMSVEEVRPPADVPRFRASLAEPPSAGAPAIFRHRRKDGREIDVEIRAQAITFDRRPARLVLAQDITARVALEAVVRQSQKMEAVGQLAGGIAHDFNNFLSVIMTYTELVRGGMDEAEPRAADLAEVSAAAERAHALTRQLLAFTRQQVVQPTVLDPNDALQPVESMLRRLLGEDITIEFRRAPEVGRIRIDQGQFEQILMNLAVNARDAMPTGGAFTVATSTADLDEDNCQLHGLTEPGRFVVLSVADTGTGMSPEVRARIFEPFFTTKDVGKGTGLGLATVYGIVAQAGGTISLYSEVGMGATFRIYFPEVELDPTAPALALPADPPPRGTETILLVEDDAAVRSAAEAVLGRLGYTVLSASGAPEAIALMARHAEEIRLIISDVVMPGTDGPSLVAGFQRDHPSVRALLMSGYAGEVLASRTAVVGEAAFLEKPFTVVKLAKKVREILDRP
jgi:hypothetical protein